MKIAVIGGGSSYTPELIEGFINHYWELPVSEIYLVDIEQGKEKLEIVGNLARRMVENANVPITINMTLDRRKAIEQADFVTTQIRVGLLEARVRDEQIPLAFNLIGQETTGAGGFAKALRTIPVILDICKEIEELAPDAHLLNFTNPAGIVTEAVLKYSNVKTIGLCNLPIGTKMRIAQLYDVNPEHVEFEMIGINHLVWTTKIMVEGKNVTDDVLKKASYTKGITVRNVPDFGWDPLFLKSLGALPCSYHKYYYMPNQMLQDQMKAMKGGEIRAKVVKKIEDELFELYQESNLKVKPKQLELRGGAYYSEAAVNLMTSIYNNKKDIQVVNVQNKGILPCLPINCSIEINCLIDKEGARPIQPSENLPTQIRGLLQIVKAYEELTIEAAVRGDVDMALQALSIHPLVGADVAQPLLAKILNENRRYLPQFN
ncbi:6-phospho-beta-glucosidase [Halalkalibacter hemicellulosilyticusJCM 9152]|uniref:6-phospho-beta-glucosidase n=1 Tax=Halalkalibacter hemicellulosilyticusJCM 9152 TaxID=1236971 RepID=W4QL83_9BACI|nr:6-phospho-beta-glucosidase [Halalkalibacter hemicellulosilyticusJCM 9152]